MTHTNKILEEAVAQDIISSQDKLTDKDFCPLCKADLPPVLLDKKKFGNTRKLCVKK